MGLRMSVRRDFGQVLDERLGAGLFTFRRAVAAPQCVGWHSPCGAGNAIAACTSEFHGACRVTQCALPQSRKRRHWLFLGLAGLGAWITACSRYLSVRLRRPTLDQASAGQEAD